MSAEKPSKSDVDNNKNEKNSVSREVGSLGVWSLSSCKPGWLYQVKDHILIGILTAVVCALFHVLFVRRRVRRGSVA